MIHVTYFKWFRSFNDNGYQLIISNIKVNHFYIDFSFLFIPLKGSWFEFKQLKFFRF